MATQQLKELCQNILSTGQFHDAAQTTDILIATLKALRDRLPMHESIHLGTLLPEDLRESYYHGWHSDQRQAESIDKSEFLAEVKLHLKGYEEHSLSDLVPVVLNSVLNMIDLSEAENVKHSLPKSMRDIFDDRDNSGVNKEFLGGRR